MFDIDKLYVARYSFNKKGKITFKNNTEEGVKNTLLRQYLRVLLTADNTGSLKLSIDNATGNVKEILSDIESNREGFRPAPFEVYTPTYQEARKAEYTGGKTDIGPFALNNAHQILTQLTKFKMIKNPFTEAMQFTDLGRIFDQPTDTDKRGSRILDWLSAMINAAVDIAKDPYIVRLNVNGWTFNMINFLLRAGKGKWTFYFMSQPILKEMALEVLKTKGKYGVDKTKTPSQLEREAIERVLKKYDPTGRYQKQYAEINKNDRRAGELYSQLFKTRMKDGVETSDLREMLLDPEFVGDANQAQVMIYYCWLKMKPYSDALADLVKYSKVDTKKYGNTFAALLNYYNGMMELRENDCFPTDEVQRFYDETFVGHKSENAILFGSQIFDNQLLRCTKLFRDQVNKTLELLGRKGHADEKLLNSIISGMESQIKAQFFNQFAKDNDIDIKGMFRGNFSMAKRLNNFKTLINRRDPRMSHLIDNNGNITNDFLEFLLPNIQDIDGTEGMLDFIDTSELLDVEQAKANNLINYWRELIEDPNPQISKLFKDLVVYAFITSGDNPVMNSFFQYVPNSYRIQMGYSDFIRKQLSDYVSGHTDLRDIQDDLFRNNWSNDKLVKPIRLTDSNDNSMLSLYDGGTVPKVIMGARLNNSGGLSTAIHPISWYTGTYMDETRGTYVEKKLPIFPPYVKLNLYSSNLPLNFHLYQLVGFTTTMDENRHVNFHPIYGLVSKKGYKYRGHTVTEYGVNTQFSFNREDEKDYGELMRTPGELVALADVELFGLGQYWAGAEPISRIIPSDLQNTKFEPTHLEDTDEDADLPDFEDTPLEDKPEPEPVSQRLDSDNKINIWYGSNENADLSNMAIRPFTVTLAPGSIGVNANNTIRFNSVEQAFQYAKNRFAPNTEYNRTVTAAILDAGTSARAKQLGSLYLNFDNVGWDNAKSDIMKRLIKQSFLQNPNALNRLLSTGNAVFTHHLERGFWREEFPEILMEVRQELRDGAYTDTADTARDPANFTMNSGGAVGADSVWGQIAAEYGIPNVPGRLNHYYNNQPTPQGNVQITDEDYQEGRYQAARAAEANWGYQYDTMQDDRLIRNWSQVKHSDAIFAVGTMVRAGERIFPNIPGDTRVAQHTAVTGGTGYAVEMAIQNNKPVYVFDQSRNRWFKNIDGQWSVSDTPTLTPNFAGIGTRQIAQNGIDAIRTVFEKTFGQAQPVDVNNAGNTMNDPTNFANEQESLNTLQSEKTILTNEELRKIRPFTGDGNPRIAVASEHTDPVFFSQKIIDILDGKASVEDRFRNQTYTGKDFAALYLITKHDGLPLKKLLEYKIPKIVHFSITGLGGTKYEPGVMKPDDLLDRIKDFLDQGLDPSMVTIRIDPIIPGVTPISSVENIVKRASEMGIKNIRFSVMDQYSTTRQFMIDLGYDYSKYYDGNSKHAREDVQQRIAGIMLGFKEKYGVNLSSCAEPLTIPGISKESCLSVSAVNNMLGTNIPETETGRQRPWCSCFGGKTDLLDYRKDRCASSCVYCYAHHNANAHAIYYNADGTLKDNRMTRTREDVSQAAQQPVQQLTPSLPQLPIDANTISNMTAEYGVEIDRNIMKNYRTWLTSHPDGIVAYRTNRKNFNTPEAVQEGIIGNPFDWLKYGEKESLQLFYKWLITGENSGEALANSAFRDAIVDKIINTDTPHILYYKEKGRPSHATVLGYLITNKEVFLNQSDAVETAITSARMDLQERLDNGMITQNDIDAFEAKLRNENPSTAEEVEGLYNNFICNL